ncbi:di-N-acetylchitobiase-like [Argopecten irradians]|uniref:di-N-acetylchitobiase-like n=1 Tax=Argopecten irradians TaxID=31199 RepID=UPI00371F467F
MEQWYMLALFAPLLVTWGTPQVSGVADCPCSNPSLCTPIKDTKRKEVFVFSLSKDIQTWKKYNWTKISTVVMVGYYSDEMMCLAHSNGARVVYIAGVPTEYLTNATLQEEWVVKNLAVVTQKHLDGLNFDYESAIPADRTDMRDGYTALVRRTYKMFKQYNPSYQITVDVAWSPACIDQRCYDFKTLSTVTDFLFVMSYDEQSQIRGPCVALANSGFYKTQSGVQKYFAAGIPPEKMVLGVPWYGYYYPCLSVTQDNVCSIKHVPFRGVNCSDAAGREQNYGYLMQIIKSSTTGRLWETSTLTPYFNYKENGTTYQIRYDDPVSLKFKFDMALMYDLRGVGIWNADALDYSQDTPEVVRQRAEMWRAFPDYKKN